MGWLDPWWPTTEWDGQAHQAYLNQLRREISPRHKIFGLALRLIGQQGSTDDTLFELLDGSGRVAVVDLSLGEGSTRAALSHYHVLYQLKRLC